MASKLIQINLTEQEARGTKLIAEFSTKRLAERKSLPAGWQLKDYLDATAAMEVLEGQINAALAEDEKKGGKNGKG